MKKLLTTIASIAIATTYVYAERINIGDYFSLNVPRSWNVLANGRTVNSPDDYLVYAAQNYSCHMTVTVLNLPSEQTGTISLANYESITEAELPALAQYNQKTGYTLPVVHKIDLSGIPAFTIRQRSNSNGVYMLSVDMWVADKHFVLEFFYTKDAIPTVNGILDSVKPELSIAEQLVRTGQASTIGDF
jgi:hypothetical protein